MGVAHFQANQTNNFGSADRALRRISINRSLCILNICQIPLAVFFANRSAYYWCTQGEGVEFQRYSHIVDVRNIQHHERWSSCRDEVGDHCDDLGAKLNCSLHCLLSGASFA